MPVDFTRDRLDDALAAAGHDPARPTTWIWEGVVMYLERADIEATLGVIQRRSAPGSHLVVQYIDRRSLLLPLIAVLLRRVGEPLRSLFSSDQFRALLASIRVRGRARRSPARDRRPAVRRPRPGHAGHEAHAHRHGEPRLTSTTVHIARWTDPLPR